MSWITSRRIAALGVWLGAAFAAAELQAFNELGHSVIARVAFERLAPAERARVVAVLRRHPHDAEYLRVGRPQDVDENEWYFWRAATWADWVRSNHRDEYHRGEWHYVNFPYRLRQSTEKLPAAIPQSRNILERLPKALATVREGGRDDALELPDGLSAEQRRAVALAWVFHLVGDLHQPLHVTALVDDERWPLEKHGDQGGNLVAITLDGRRPRKLHAYWDGALDLPMNAANVAQVVRGLTTDPPLSNGELARRLKVRSVRAWAGEGYRLAARHAYLSGELQPAPWKKAYDQSEPEADASVPRLPPEVQEETRLVYRRQLLVAGARLADQLRDVLGE